MEKLIKSVKTTIFIFIILANLFYVSYPVNATPRLNSNVNIFWGENDAIKPIIPRDEIRKLNLTIQYNVDYGGDFAYGALIAYSQQGINVPITLAIIDKSPWCTADLQPETVPVLLSASLTQSNAILNLQINDDAPAYGAGYITIQAASPVMGLMSRFEKNFTLDFVPEYLPRIDVNLPEGSTKNMGPMETIVLPIKINNMGNARTTVFFNVENLSKGWVAAVTDDVTLEDSETQVAYLTVKPPKEFGYHYDVESIMVKLTPARAEDLANIGKPLYVTFIVQSRGFSTPGFEAIIFIGAFAIAVLLFFNFSKKKLS